MKDLKNITEDEVKTICKIYDEPYINHLAGIWKDLDLAIQINTTSTIHKNSQDDSYIAIYYDGRIKLTRNNGNYGGMRTIDINPLITIDYLRNQGYEFKYEIPKQLKRKFKLNNINKIAEL